MTDRADLPARLRTDAECVTSPVLTNWPDTSLPQAISDDMREAAARIEALEADKARLDWLEQHVVNVRDPLVYGSRDMFWSSPDAERVEGEVFPSDIRAAIDKQRALTPESPQ